MISLNRKQQGFTIVELLIVIVVIGILAALVVTTFSGTQKKARDAERKSDINILYSQLEVYFADKATYPTLANLNDGAANGWRVTNMKDLKDDALKDPKGTAATLVAAPASSSYAYAVTPANCDNTTGNECTGYTLTATLEGGGTFVKTGSNN